MKASLTVLAAVAWLVSATLWWWASHQPPPRLREPTADMDRGAYKPFDNALRGAAQRNKYGAGARWSRRRSSVSRSSSCNRLGPPVERQEVFRPLPVV